MSTEKTLDERWSDMSDQYLEDAVYEGQSMHGRISCAFESGYLAVLRCLGPDAQHRYEHPDIGALRALGRLCNVDVGLALKFLAHRYAGDTEQLPALPAMLFWAQKMRVLAKAKAEMPDAIETDPDHL